MLSALYDPFKENEAVQKKHLQEFELHALYLMMGQGLKPLAYSWAGNVVAIRGLGHQTLKSATLSSTRNCWRFSTMVFQVAPTVRVSVELIIPRDIAALTKGLRLLSSAGSFCRGWCFWHRRTSACSCKRGSSRVMHTGFEREVCKG